MSYTLKSGETVVLNKYKVIDVCGLVYEVLAQSQLEAMRIIRGEQPRYEVA